MKKTMMKKTTLREIRSTFGRFAAILAIIALGVGFFSGVRETTPAMVNMMSEFLNEKQFFDYRLISTMGWDKSSPAEFAAKPNVRFAEGGISLDTVFDWVHSPDDSNEEIVLRAHMIPENVNGLKLIDGRMPESAAECIADCRKGFKVGDTLQLSDNNEEKTLDSYAGTEQNIYRVVGIADSSLYINFERGTTSAGNGSLYGFVYFPADSFDIDYFTEIYVRFDHDYKIYSDEYEEFMKNRSDDWKTIAQSQADLRYDEVYSEAQQELDDGRAELEENRADGQKELDEAKVKLDDAKKELDDARKSLDDAKKDVETGEKEIADNKKKLDDGKAELAKSKKTLDDSKKQLDDTEKQLSDASAQLSDGQAQLDSAHAELDAKQEELDAQEIGFYQMYGEMLENIDLLPEDQQRMLNSALEQIDSAKDQIMGGRIELQNQQSALDEKRTELEAGLRELESGKAKYQQGLADYRKAESELAKGEKDYKDGVKKFEDGKKEYEDGLADYENGKSDYEKGLADYNDGLTEFNEKIAEAEKEIADGESKLADLKMPEVYILDRSANIGAACFENDSEIVEQVAKVFPIFFILVAALVCMTTMSRMVEEQRTQIGMFKALGYSEISIMGKFMFYSGSASLIGCIIGFFGGTYMFPAIIWITYKLMYIPLDIPYLFDWTLCLAVTAVSLICSLGMTWLSCRYELSETAANLMRPKAPKAGKRVLPERIPFIWNRLKFLHKVSLRNIFRYKGRFFMMVVGIGGCTALLLTGFGLKDSIAGFADIQYEEIQTADAIVSYNADNSEKVRGLLEEYPDIAMFNSSSWDLIYGSKVKAIELETMENFDDLADLMDFHTVNGRPLDYPDSGEALVSHSVAERYGAVEGSEITLRDENMRELHLKVVGVFENHVYNYIFISADTYNDQLGEYPELNTAYFNFTENADHYAEAAALSSNENINAISLFSETKTRLSNMMSSLDYIVILVIACAAGLAFIVIYNLTNINITERTREIATIKVLGFFRSETSAYVLRENLALTAFGTVAGLIMGVLLHRFVMAQIVVDMVDFSARILPISFVFSIILTFVFNFIVNIFMSAKLEKINMAESLKSVD